MKQFFLILSGLALLTGCSSKNDSVEGPVQSRIRIAPSISRVTGLNFDTGDRIGLTIVKSGANYCENTPLRFDGTVFVSDDLFWYDDPSENRISRLTIPTWRKELRRASPFVPTRSSPPITKPRTCWQRRRRTSYRAKRP